MLKLFQNKTVRNHLSGFAVMACSIAFGIHLIRENYITAFITALVVIYNYAILSEDF